MEAGGGLWGGLGTRSEAAGQQSSAPETALARGIAQSVLLYVLFHSADIQIQVKDGGVVGQEVREASP